MPPLGWKATPKASAEPSTSRKRILAKSLSVGPLARCPVRLRFSLLPSACLLSAGCLAARSLAGRTPCCPSSFAAWPPGPCFGLVWALSVTMPGVTSTQRLCGTSSRDLVSGQLGALATCPESPERSLKLKSVQRLVRSAKEASTPVKARRVAPGTAGSPKKAAAEQYPDPSPRRAASGESRAKPQRRDTRGWARS